MREKLCHGEDSGKNASHTDRTAELSHSCLIDKDHLYKDCQGVSIKVDSRDPYPSATATDREQEKSQILCCEANEHGLSNETMKIGENQSRFDRPNNSGGMIFHLASNIEVANLNILFSNCEVVISVMYFCQKASSYIFSFYLKNFT